jgi:acyl-[acyl-carrier-protein]-phospholipid O-acyltransferase/long-chain-fatty-acid--[acyl-carrier-protein] ligase
LSRSRTFLAFFLTQFLGALNDNLFKTALSLLIAFRASEQSQSESSVLVNLAAILFILPFFLLSPRAGALADLYPKVTLIQRIKLFEIGLMTLAIGGFYLGNIWLLLVILFLMGTQSTFFGPLKYSYLPEVLDRSQLVGANAMIQGSTFVGIILGMILAGVLFALSDQHLTGVWLACLGIAGAGYLASRLMPAGQFTPLDHAQRHRGIVGLIKLARAQPEVWRAIVGISWFWLVGATYVTQLPNFVRFQLYADEQVFLLCLALFAIGIGAGALTCNWLNRSSFGRYSVLLGLVGLVIAGVMLPSQLSGAHDGLLGMRAFLQTVDPWLLWWLFALGVSGGLYIVPLYTVLQVQSDQEHRSRMVAANNVMNALFMVVSAAAALVLLGSGMTIDQLFIALALANLVTLGLFALIDRRFLTGVQDLYR